MECRVHCSIVLHQKEHYFLLQYCSSKIAPLRRRKGALCSVTLRLTYISVIRRVSSFGSSSSLSFFVYASFKRQVVHAHTYRMFSSVEVLSLKYLEYEHLSTIDRNKGHLSAGIINPVFSKCICSFGIQNYIFFCR